MIMLSKPDCLSLFSVTLFVALFTKRHPYVYIFILLFANVMYITNFQKQQQQQQQQKKLEKSYEEKKDFELNIQTK